METQQNEITNSNPNITQNNQQSQLAESSNQFIQANSSPNNQKQEISNQEGKIPEISNQQQDNQQQNQNNPPISEANKIENPQSVPQPQPPPEKKIIFTHPMYNFCSEEKIKEIEQCPPTNIFYIVNIGQNHLMQVLKI